jgi:hypothetical protein
VVHEEDGAHDRHVTASQGDGVDLEDFAEAAEHARDAGRVDVLSLEAGGRDESADACVSRDAAESFLGEEVDTSLIESEGLHVDGGVPFRTRGEAEVHGAHRGAHNLERQVCGDVRERSAHSSFVVDEGVGRLDEHHREAPRSLQVTGRHEDFDEVRPRRLAGERRRAAAGGEGVQGRPSVRGR